MKSANKIAISLALFSSYATFVAAQSNAGTSKSSVPTHHKPAKKASAPSLESQIQQMRQELQSQIDELKLKLAAKDDQIEALKVQSVNTQQGSAASASSIQSLDSKLQQHDAAVGSLQASVTDLREKDAAVSSTVQQVRSQQRTLQKSIDEPVALHYKGISITPGGFLAGESIWRQRAMNDDIYTAFNTLPYMNSGEAHTSEWVPSARATRLSTLFSGKVPFGTASAFFEGDFLSAGITSNNTQSNSYTLRVRQAWGQAAFGHFKFTGGQMWTLLAEDKKAADPASEWAPIIFDQNLHVGATYLRQPGFRLQDSLSPKFTVAMSLENSQYQFSASNAPANFFFGSPGALGGLNNSSANYTNQVAPDLLVKATYEPGYGHYEIGGLVRFFRDRYYPGGTTAAGAQNDTRVGGGFVANARFPVTAKVDVGLHVVAGDGTGRYGASLLPDITVRSNGTLSPLRNAQGLFSVEYHPTKKLDIFGYAGTEYVQRTFYISGTGALVGYAPVNGNNAGCDTEAVPTAGTGFAPGISPCLGATRDIAQYSGGWVYRIYSGPAGRLQYGAAYSYLTRNGWTGIGGAPKGTNNFVYTSFRYYIP
jgi:FtsZ-binding cell division protein ZapB